MISGGKGIIPNENIDEINEGDEWHDIIGGDDDDPVEDSEMRSRSDFVNDNDDNLFSVFDESTCSGNRVCDILLNEDDIITEDYSVSVNTKKETFHVMVIKIPFSGFPHYSNRLKMIWIHTKNKEVVSI